MAHLLCLKPASLSRYSICVLLSLIIGSTTVHAQLFKNLGGVINSTKTQVTTQQKQKDNKPTEQQTTAAPQPKTAQIIYVSKSTGKNKNDGSISAPLKNIQKAVDIAAEGALIRVAEGNYFGNLDCGNIKITKPVTIEGGWNTDFTERNTLRYLTMIQPSQESNGTATLGTLGTMHIEIPTKGDIPMELDGLIFDRGYTNAYNPRGEGKPEGVLSPMMQETPGQSGIGGDDEMSISGCKNNDYYTLYFKVSCPINIRNCAFINSRTQAVEGGIGEGKKATITNNIFVNSRMAACEINGNSATLNAEVEFAYNTILFAWTRTRTFEDMGYGYRFMNRINGNVHHCILGCCCFAALDRCRIDSPADREAKKVTIAEHNRFFLNKQADLMIPGGGKFMRIWANQFEDVEQLARENDNVTITDPKALNNAIDEAYLKGWINLSYGESSSFDRNSGANQFREAMGMSMQGTMNSKASMWANRYPWRKALELFGAMSGYGAQVQ